MASAARTSSMSIEQPKAKRAEVDPIVEIVDIKFIKPEVPHSGRGTIIDTHIQQSKNLKFVRSNTLRSPASENGSNKRKGKET